MVLFCPPLLSVACLIIPAFWENKNTGDLKLMRGVLLPIFGSTTNNETN